VCRLITKAAITRQESRGGHIRKEFDGENREFLHHSIQQLGREMYFIPVETQQTN